MKQSWIFYTVDKEGRYCIFNERECIKPELTKDWKELQLHLDKPFVERVGYVMSEHKEYGNYQTKEDIQLQDTIKSFKSMIRSLYCYDGLKKDSTYLTNYINKLGETNFNKIYDEYSKELQDNFKIVRGVYTDHEGCTYNKLEEI